MRLHALIFFLAVSHTRAIPIELEKNEDVQPAVKGPIEDVNVENLRSVPDVIPVAIVDDTIPKLKLDENSNDYIPSDDEPSINIKRLEIDLNNPGPPQRQQHETQNPEFYSERDYFVADIKQKLLDTENVFKKSVSDVNVGFENWVPNSEHLKTIQTDIKEMQKKFLAQLDSLNQSLQSYLNPQSAKAVIVDPESTANLKEVESRLKVLENNFKVGVQTLSEGVKALEAKADGDASGAEKPAETGSPSPAPANPTNEQPSNNPISNIFQFFANAMGNAINQIQSSLNSFNNPSNQNNDAGSNTNNQVSWNPLPGLFNPSTSAPPSEAQSDEASTARPPTIWENVQTQLGQIFNGGQSLSNPINQANQMFQNIFAPFRPPASPTPTETKPQANQTPQSSSTPSKPVEPQPEIHSQPAITLNQVDAQPSKPQAAEPPKDTQATPQPGPIRQMVQNNPIVKGIVQRIQSISNPEKPREEELQQVSEPVKTEDPVEEESAPATKGHGGYYGNNGGTATAGDNNNSDGINVEVSSDTEEIKEVPHICEMAKNAEAASDKEEKDTDLLTDKTE